MPPSPRGSSPASVVGKHADGRLGSAPQVLGRRDLEDRAADPESLTGSAPPLDVALSFRTSPAGCLRAFKRREPIDNVNKKYYEERTLEKHFRRLECKSMDCKFNTCNDESYVPSLERLQSESRAAAERRCKDNDAMIGKHYTYENIITTSNDRRMSASSIEDAMQAETDVRHHSFDHSFSICSF